MSEHRNPSANGESAKNRSGSPSGELASHLDRLRAEKNERLRRKLGAQRMNQAVVQVHRAVGAMALVLQGLGPIVDAQETLDKVLDACAKLREALVSVDMLQHKLEQNGGPLVSSEFAAFELGYRKQR